MACSSYECFILRAVRLSNKHLGQGYVIERLDSSLRKFYGRYGGLIKQYEVPLPIVTRYCGGWPYTVTPSIDETLHQFLTVTDFVHFHSKNLQITSKLLTQGYRYHKLRKTFGKFFRSYSEFLSKFGDISFQEYVFKGISHPVFYGDLVYKLRRVKDTPNFISSGSKIVKRLRRRQYDPLIIETTIGLVLGPCTALCRLFLKHCTLTNKAVGTI